MHVVASEVVRLVEPGQIPHLAVVRDVLSQRASLLVVGPSLMLSDLRRVRAERAVLADIEPVREAMAFDPSCEPLPLVGERGVGRRPFADHIADVFWRLGNGAFELLAYLLFLPALELSLGGELHDQVVGMMFEPVVRVTPGRTQPLEFQFGPAGIGLVALGVLSLERCIMAELLSLMAMPPSDSRCLHLELRGARCLVVRRHRVMSVFLLKPHRLVRGLAIEAGERAVRGGGLTQLLIGDVLDFASRGSERLLER